MFKDICLDIESKTILNNVNFELEQGKISVLLGPNGCGKTTLLKCIKGLYNYHSGEIIYYNKSKKSLKDAIMVFDEPILYEELTGNEHIEFIQNISNNKINKEYISQLIEELDMKKNMDNLISSYSLGMKKKIQFICSMISNPEILLMDEFISGLDPSILYKFKQILKEYSSYGKYILLSTHMLDMAEKFCDNVILMSEGKIINNQAVNINEILKVYSSLEEYYLSEMKNK